MFVVNIILCLSVMLLTHLLREKMHFFLRLKFLDGEISKTPYKLESLGKGHGVA